MDQALLKPLDQLESSLDSLLKSLTTTNTYTAAPAAAQSLLNADDALTSALIQLKQHQENHTRIQSLRAEAQRLQTQLRDIVRTCVDLRREIGQIHPSILEDSDDEDDVAPTSPPPNATAAATTKKENAPVDYDTLLSFAARIGKHNAAAAIEAERQSNTRDAARANGGDAQQTNGATGVDSANATEESLAALAAINDTMAQQRAYQGMAFPAADALRMGELGRLQYIREQEGEDAVDREIERLVRGSERVVGGVEDEGEVVKEEDNTFVQPERVVDRAPVQQSLPRPPPSLPPKPKVALDLDFPGSDDDDDD